MSGTFDAIAEPLRGELIAAADALLEARLARQAHPAAG